MTIDLAWLWKPALAALLGYGALNAWQHREYDPGPGMVAPHYPRQQLLADGERRPFTLKDYTITPLAGYAIEARVLGNEPYRFDPVSDLSPLDLALGWGPMSDRRVLERIELDQGSRWLSWRSDAVPYPLIVGHAANVHIIPGSGRLGERLRALRVGQVVALRGYLVEARRAGGAPWSSSLRRDDTGDGACEIFYVEDLRVL